jgi:hypothetical protein
MAMMAHNARSVPLTLLAVGGLCLCLGFGLGQAWTLRQWQAEIADTQRLHDEMRQGRNTRSEQVDDDRLLLSYIRGVGLGYLQARCGEHSPFGTWQAAAHYYRDVMAVSPETCQALAQVQARHQGAQP